MEVLVFSPQRTMVAAMFPTAFKALFMSQLVLLGLIFVIIAMLSMISRMSVVVVVRASWSGGRAERQHSSRS